MRERGRGERRDQEEEGEEEDGEATAVQTQRYERSEWASSPISVAVMVVCVMCWGVLGCVAAACVPRSV